MKKLILSLVCLLSFSALSLAQPIFDSAAICPQPGDTIVGHQSDTTGVTPGPSGAGVTWNFKILPDLGTSLLTYSGCPSTAGCDSFPGTNLVGYDGSDYLFYTASKDVVSMKGVYTSFGLPIYIHLNKYTDLQAYPMAYLSIHKDTTEAAVNILGTDYYHLQVDSSVCDGYGTLILPSDTLTNVLRIHTFTMTVDSTAGTTPPDTSFTQTYNYFDSGFHNSRLTYTIDTVNGNDVIYYTGQAPVVAPPLAVQSVVDEKTMVVYPNPANDKINIRFNTPDAVNTTINITDVTGRSVGKISGGDIKTGINTVSFPTTDLAPGMYMVSLVSGTQHLVQKIVVAK